MKAETPLTLAISSVSYVDFHALQLAPSQTLLESILVFRGHFYSSTVGGDNAPEGFFCETIKNPRIKTSAL